MTTNTIDLSDSDIPYNYEYNTVNVLINSEPLKITNIRKSLTDTSSGAIVTTSAMTSSFTVEEFFNIDHDQYVTVNHQQYVSQTFLYIYSATVYREYVLDFSTVSLDSGFYELVFFVDSLDIYGCIKVFKNTINTYIIESYKSSSTVIYISFNMSGNSINITINRIIATINGSDTTTNNKDNTQILISDETSSIDTNTFFKYKINKI